MSKQFNATESNACNDCSKCTLPGCIEDGYHPRVRKRNIKEREWSENDILKLKALYTIYDTKVLANIFLMPEDQVIKKLEELNV